ncbi:MAG: heavy metal transporter [Burkholderiales bacterium]|nr:heavy metal transporter [Burkholderiales bacterium]
MSYQNRLSIPGMKCSGCAAAVQEALDNRDDVERANADLKSKTVLVESDAPLSALIDTLKSAGFDATEVEAKGGEVRE